MSGRENGGRRGPLRSLLGRLGERVAGEREPVDYALIAPDDLPAWRARGARIVDVREPREYAGGHVPGAENVPLARFLADLGDPGGPIVLVCASGNRSATAARALAARGHHADVADLAGGTAGWVRSGRPLEGGRAP